MPGGRFISFADQVLDHSIRAPDRRAVVCDGALLTYGELVERAQACASGLRGSGLSAGGDSRVGALGPNSLDMIVVLMACQMTGVTFVPLPVQIAPDAHARMLADANVTLLFVDEAYEEKARAAGALLPEGMTLYFVPIGTAGSRALDGWLPDSDAGFKPAAVEADWSSDLIYSSGTTGEPKGIVQSYAGRVGSCVSLAHLGFGPEMGFLHTIGLYSNFGLSGALLTLWWGGTFFMMRKFSADAVVATLTTEKIDMAWFAPATMIRTLEAPGLADAVRAKPCVKLCAGAPLSEAHKSQVLTEWPGTFYDLYGQTETGTLTLLAMHSAPVDKLGSVGKLLPTVAIRILDDQGRSLPVGEEGEIAGHSNTMMSGYHQRDEANASALWLDETGRAYMRTGDIGRLDADGYLWLCDRKKDMILSGGYNIYPADIERAFGDHPSVFEVAVVGCPSARWGESPVAFLTLRDGLNANEDELRTWVNARLGSIQRVAAVKILPALPNGTMGKILKRELRDAFAAEIGLLP